RVAARSLAHLLARHPQTRRLFRPACIVGGESQHAKRQDFFAIPATEGQTTAVQDLRSGKVNLIVATSVLEEGIDISACQLVVTYDEISNLRAFVQRRGRARKSDSTYAVFVDEAKQDQLARFQKMEALMKQAYADELRLVSSMQQQEEEEEEGYGSIASATGAVLSLENARPRLEHFCATLGYAYTDTRPDFVLDRSTPHPHPGGERALRSATVFLPAVLPPELRTIAGCKAWKTQRMAIRDAAFQACKALWTNGLLNDRFLPTHKHFFDSLTPIERRQATADVPYCPSPWMRVAAAWTGGQKHYKVMIEDRTGSDLVPPRMLAILPVPLPCPISLRLHWTAELTLVLSLTAAGPCSTLALDAAAEATQLLYESALRGRLKRGRRDFCCLFLPKLRLTPATIEKWCATAAGHTPALAAALHEPLDLQSLGLVSQSDGRNRPWFPQLLEHRSEQRCNEDGSPGEMEDVLHIRGLVWPKRADFTHTASSGSHTHWKSYPVAQSKLANLPAAYSVFTLFVPAVLHRLEVFLHADHLRETVLAPLRLRDLSLLVDAISSPLAREPSNYQRLEFLGDALLKLHCSVHLTASRPQWHEGLLTAFKERLVSNHRLSAVALERGIAPYILTDAFTAAQWRPQYVHEFACDPARADVSTRSISTKVLADVVEAIIGAAFVDGGLSKTTAAMNLLLPEETWPSLEDSTARILQAVPAAAETIKPSYLASVEGMIGYKFSRPAILLEALTHPSSTADTMSYQRLEFLGDALLDHLVTECIFKHRDELSVPDMHLIRTAFVNRDFLAFVCMKLATQESRFEVVKAAGTEQYTPKEVAHTIRLIQMLRHANRELATSRARTIARFQRLEASIDDALDQSAEYPWVLLCQLQAPKYMSDVIESLLAAIYVDSSGSWARCDAFLSRLGLNEYLSRVLRGNINLMHPKQRLGILVEGRKVAYAKTQTDDLRFDCVVCVDGAEVAGVTGALSDHEAETRAACRAMKAWAAMVSEGKVRRGTVTPDADALPN
ncbi:Dicer-like protein 2, partial [Ascosphaera acerosa]